MTEPFSYILIAYEKIINSTFFFFLHGTDISFIKFHVFAKQKIFKFYLQYLCVYAPKQSLLFCSNIIVDCYESVDRRRRLYISYSKGRAAAGPSAVEEVLVDS